MRKSPKSSNPSAAATLKNPQLITHNTLSCAKRSNSSQDVTVTLMIPLFPNATPSQSKAISASPSTMSMCTCCYTWEVRTVRMFWTWMFLRCVCLSISSRMILCIRRRGLWRESGGRMEAGAGWGMSKWCSRMCGRPKSIPNSKIAQLSSSVLFDYDPEK